VPPAVQVRLSVTHVLDGLIIVQCRRLCSTSSKCCSAACAFEVFVFVCIFSILIIQRSHQLVVQYRQLFAISSSSDRGGGASSRHHLPAGPVSVHLYFCIFYSRLHVFLYFRIHVCMYFVCADRGRGATTWSSWSPVSVARLCYFSHNLLTCDPALC